MSISLGNYAFNESRISTILKSESLEEAQSMGLLDRVIDFFRGGVKRAAIETVFKQITAADRDHGADPEAKQLARFETLRAMVKPEHAGKFSVDVAIDPQAKKWGYAFSIDGTKMVSKKDIPLGRGHDYAAYQDAAILGRTTQVLVDAGRTDALDVVARLRGEFSACNSERQEICAFDADAATKFTSLAHALSDERLPMEVKVKGRDSYELTINGQTVHSGRLQPEKEDVEGQFAEVVAARVQIAKNQIYRDFEDVLSNPQALIEANLQCMVDGKKEQEELRSRMTDPAFSRATFTGFRESEDGATFVAIFGKHELVFSNRIATNNELRGDRLKTMLQGSNYSCLEDIAKQGHLTESDPMLRYAYTPGKHDYFGVHKELMSSDESTRLDQAVAGIKVGNTTLGALWKLDGTPPQVQAVKQENTGQLTSYV